jgi:hypothetical protein
MAYFSSFCDRSKHGFLSVRALFLLGEEKAELVLTINPQKETVRALSSLSFVV